MSLNPDTPQASEKDARQAIDAGLRALLQQRLWIRDCSPWASQQELDDTERSMRDTRDRLQPLLQSLSQAQQRSGQRHARTHPARAGAHEPHAVVLGSTSRYRAELLRRMLDDFNQAAPGTDEAALPGESPADRALRLAMAKASAVARTDPDALVIGSDQVAELDGQVLDKPGSVERARAQLLACSGRDRALPYRAVPAGYPRGHAHNACRPHPRGVPRADGGRSGALRRARACRWTAPAASSARGWASACSKRIESEDPTALVGLPLIALARLLREAGVDLP